MRRTTLVEALEKLQNDLQSSGLRDYLRDIINKARSDKVDSISTPLGVFQNWTIAISSYSDAEHYILETMGVRELLHLEFWESLDETSLGKIYPVYNNVEALFDMVPKIINLIDQKEVRDVKSGSSEVDISLRGGEILTIILGEDLGEHSKIDRVTRALNAIESLYVVHAAIQKIQPHDLIVLACDSGSDKSFDLFGFAKTVEAVKGTILSIWDRIIFAKSQRANADIDTIGKSLPVLAEISALESRKEIEPTLAEQLRRKVLGACKAIQESGVLIPEMDKHSSFSPRQLMAPSPRLLTGPKIEDASAPSEVKRSAERDDTDSGQSQTDGSQSQTDDSSALRKELAEMRSTLSKLQKEVPSRRPARKGSRVPVGQKTPKNNKT